MHWGNATISSKVVQEDGTIVINAKVDEEDKDFKKTKKITWVCNDEATKCPITLIEYDHLITVKKTDDQTKVQDHVNPNSKIVY